MFVFSFNGDSDSALLRNSPGIASSLRSLQAQPAGGILGNPLTMFAAQASLDVQTLSKSCGETGIRTPETLLKFTRFPGVPLKPLEHLSSCALGRKSQYRLQRYCFFRKYARVCANFYDFFAILCQKGIVHCDLWPQLCLLRNNYRPARAVPPHGSSNDFHCVLLYEE